MFRRAVVARCARVPSAATTGAGSAAAAAVAAPEGEAAAAPPLTQEELLARIRACSRAEEEQEAQRRISSPAVAQRASQMPRVQRSVGSSHDGFWRFGAPVLTLSLAFVGGALYIMSGMRAREDDNRVCINCNRQREIVEEIYFGKPPKKSERDHRMVRVF